MIWRGTVTPLDRLYSSLPYALPMASAVFYGAYLFSHFPPLIYPFFPFVLLKGLLGFQVIPGLISLDFVAFICLYLFVVRNERLRHFIRFNTMQSLLLGILLALIEILLGLLAPVFRTFPNNLLFLGSILANTIFIGMTAACAYAVFQTVRGLYAEMPVVSEAAYYQVRY